MDSLCQSATRHNTAMTDSSCHSTDTIIVQTVNLSNARSSLITFPLKCKLVAFRSEPGLINVFTRLHHRTKHFVTHTRNKVLICHTTLSSWHLQHGGLLIMALIVA